MAALPVYTDDVRYTSALTQLPLRSVPARDPRDALVVISGAPGWGARAVSAAAAGAVGLVIADPGMEPAEVGALSDIATRLPLALARPRLRHDEVAALSAAVATTPRAIRVHCSAPGEDLPGMLCDAIGWTRALSRAALTVRASWTRRGRGLVHLATDAPTVSADIVLAPAAVGGLRVLTLDDDRAEVVVRADGATSASITTAAGTRWLPERLELAERAALRRALEAVAAGVVLPDLDQWRHDARLASLIVRRTGRD